LYPEIGAVLADGTTEYEPMGAYYTEAWDFSDDKLTLNVSGLDILGYINSLRDVSAFPSGAPFYNAKASEMISTLIARASCGYSVVVNNEGDLGTVTLFGSLDTITFGNVSLRQVLTWVAELAMGFVSSPYRYATGYTQTSRFKNTVDMTYRFADLVSFTALKTITADNYFKIKTILERSVSANTYYIDAVDGNQYISANTARQATEGVVSQVVCQGNPIVKEGLIEGQTIQFAMDYIVQNQGDRLRIEWQGDPSLDLCDFTQIQSIYGLTGYNGYMVSNQIKFDGGLRQISTFKILETEAL
jgi:hypothetical protein